MLTLKQLNEILDYIDPRRLSFEEWVKITAAIKNECGKQGKLSWDNWSRQDSERYNREQNYKEWDSLKRKPNDPRGYVTAGTLIMYARENGYKKSFSEKRPEKHHVLNKNVNNYHDTLLKPENKVILDHLIEERRYNLDLINVKKIGYDPNLKRIVFPFLENNYAVDYLARKLEEDTFYKRYPMNEYHIKYEDFYNKKAEINFPSGKRTFNNFPKYLRASDNYYKKCGEELIHNLPYNYDSTILEEDEIYLTEGIPDSDTLLLFEQGLSNMAVGTKFVNDEGWKKYVFPQLRKVKKITLIGDNDFSGIKATVNQWIDKQLLPHRFFNFDVIIVPRLLDKLTDKNPYNGYFSILNRNRKYKESDGIKDLNQFYCENGESLKELQVTRINGFVYLALFAKEEAKINNTPFIETYFDDYVEPYRDFLTPDNLDNIFRDLDKYTELEAFTQEECKAIKKSFKNKTLQAGFKNKVINKNNLIYLHGGFFYKFNGKVWEQIEEEELKGEIQEQLGFRNETDSNTKSVLNLIESDKRVYLKNPDFNKKNGIVFNNGTLYYSPEKIDFQLNYFNPDDHITFKSDFDYTPEAKCPKWENFLADALEVKDPITGETDIKETQNKIDLVQEYLGYTLVDSCQKGQKCLILQGNGGNGKSVFLDTVKKLFCETAITDIPLQSLGSQFQFYPLKDSILNISEETDEKFTDKNTKIFNSAITGGTLRDSRKNHDVIDFESRAKWIISANNDFIIWDKSNAIYRRLLFVRFPYDYTDKDYLINNPRFHKYKKINVELKEELINEELPGIFNWMLEGYQRIVNNHFIFTETAENENILFELKYKNNYIRQFVFETCMFKLESSDPRINASDGLIVSKKVIYENYEIFCNNVNIQPKPPSAFFGEFNRQLTDLDFKFDPKARKQINKNRETVYKFFEIPEVVKEEV